MQLHFGFELKYFDRFFVAMAIPVVCNRRNEEEQGTSAQQEQSEIPKGEVAFLLQLVKELAAVCRKLRRNYCARGTRRRRILDEGISNRQQTQLLPDLVSCHVGPAITLLSPPPPPPSREEQSPNAMDINQLSTSTYRPLISHDADNLSFTVKMRIDQTHRRIGRWLRDIADQFRQQNHNHNRRPNSVCNHSRIRLEIALTFVIPVTLIGIGVIILKRKIN